MREIKFRAWHSGFDKMIHSFPLVSHGEFDAFFLSASVSHYNEQLILMQYTGLKDKTETWESDIVKLYDGRIGIIKVSDNLTAYIEATDGSIYDLNVILSTEFEVIGNTYENEDLIK